jgi:hypothetical protein
MPDGVEKTALQTKQTSELATLTENEVALKAIVTPGKTAREKVKDKAGSSWERAKENPWKTAAIVT